MTQDTRLIRLSGSFVDSSCVAVELEGREALSSPYEFQVQFLTDSLELSCEDVIGQKIGIAIHNQGRTEGIYRHGRVNRLVLNDVNESGVRFYQIQVVPGFWFLSQANHNRIFENKTSLEIAEEIISSYGPFCELETKTNGTYIKREYCVQFNETDLEFVERILAEDGITYYFTFTENSHTLILTDQTNGYVDCPETKVVKRGLSREEGAEGAVIRQWSRALSYHPQAYQLLDYNQDTPKNFYKQRVPTTSSFSQTPPMDARVGFGCQTGAGN